ncbi:MAG TPA: sigma-70 factor domain-containing protein, partial [Geminicoccaceae bacterium]|nr:sigma-70 factor domain-containing protein [Geminicoccaceae bacterium]
MAKGQLARTSAPPAKAKSTPRPEPDDGLEALLAGAPQLRRLLLAAKDKGSITVDQLNAALPADFPPEQSDEVIALLEGRGMGVVQGEPAGEGEPADAVEGGEPEPAPPEGEEAEESPAGIDEEDLGRTDDPVRMYLREMGTIELLSREGEIEIAKRIEAGRNMVLEALCESPLTMRAVIGWRDAIREGRVLLRDIIDLDATHDAIPGAPGAAAPALAGAAVLQLAAVAPVAAVAPADAAAVAPVPTPAAEAPDAAAGPVAPVAAVPEADEAGGDTLDDEAVDDDEAEDDEVGDDEVGDDEADEAIAGGEEDPVAAVEALIAEVVEEEEVDEDTLSLSALENKLRDGVLATFDEIAEAYGELRLLQEDRLAAIQASEAPDADLDRRYQAARQGMVELMKQVSLNQNRVEALVEQLFDMNKLLQSLEGKLMRLAVGSRVARESFLKEYFGHELDPDWIDRVARLRDRGWPDFVQRHYEEVKSLRDDIAAIAEETGL